MYSLLRMQLKLWGISAWLMVSHSGVLLLIRGEDVNVTEMCAKYFFEVELDIYEWRTLA